jgi:hypothetical protein
MVPNFMKISLKKLHVSARDIDMSFTVGINILNFENFAKNAENFAKNAENFFEILQKYFFLFFREK